MNVKAWYEKVIIPTYGIGKPEKNPMFLERDPAVSFTRIL